MNAVDRLIEKARKIKLTYGDNVFIITKESGGWTVDGRIFPTFEAAQEYVDGLISDDGEDSATVIINDLGPCNMGVLKELAVKDERMDHPEKAPKRIVRSPKKDRRLI